MRLFNIWFFILVFLLISIEAQAQTVIKIPQIDLISYNNHGTATFYQKAGEDIYYRISINTSNSDTLKIDKENPLTLEEIKCYKGVIIISVEELRKQNLSEFQTYLMQNSWKLGEEERKKKILLKTINPAMISLSEVQFARAYFGGFGSSYVENPDNDVKKWRPYISKFLNIIYIEVDAQTYFVIFTENSNKIGFFLPLERNDIIFNNAFYRGEAKKLMVNDSLANISTDKILKNFNPSSFYSAKKLPNGKVTLNNYYGDVLIDREFDTISFNSFFILGKHEKEYVVYRNDLAKVDLGTIKNIYLYRDGLELLNEDGAGYYDDGLNKVESFPPLLNNYCGTVPHRNYQLQYKPNAAVPHSIALEKGHFGSSGFETVYFLKGLSKNQKISFLNNRLNANTDSNTNFLPSNGMSVSILKVEKDGKFGLIKYDISKARLKRPTPKYYKLSNGDSLPVPSLPIDEGTIKVSEILPIEYDSIIFNEEENQIFIYKNQKVGLYPQHDEVVYDALEPKTNSFYYFSKNGQKGYLDRKTGLEYLD